MITLIKDTGKKIIENSDFISIKDIARDEGILLPCGGNGICRKCKIKVSGILSPLTEEEKESLTSDEIKEGIRLACFCKIKEGKIFINNKETFVTNVSSLQYKKVKNPGIAIDIGSTTIASCLYDVNDKNVYKTYGEKCSLFPFGSDVLSRVNYYNLKRDNKMTEILQNQVADIIKKYEENKNAKITVTGNTVMLSILKGESLLPFTAYPFNIEEKFDKIINIKGYDIYFPPVISAFIGADVVTGVIGSKLYKENNSMLIDLGTNGEIALIKDKNIYTTSVPMGPAFEGGEISCGTYAREGAICKVIPQGTNLRYKTINNEKPVGICGSGLIDLMAIFVRYKVIDCYGNIKNYANPFTGLIKDDKIYLSGSDIYVSKEDIYNFLKARTALYTGILALMKASEIKEDDINNVYIAGGFSNSFNINNAIYINMFPKSFKEKITVLGNTAIIGAKDYFDLKDFLFKVINLTDNDFFNRYFIENMRFDL